MFNRPLTVDDLARLKQERDHADRLYNEVLTALDGAVRQLRGTPPPPPSYDEHQITPLNERWDLLEARPSHQPGWRGRVRSFILETVAPLFERQQAFNSALVDHINRNVATHREIPRALAGTIALVGEELEQLHHFEHRLILYAQQLTPYVDTKDRDVTSLIVEVPSSVGAAAERDRVRDQAAAERDQGVEDLRASFGVVHQVTQMLRRELGRLQEAGASAPTRRRLGAPIPAVNR